MAFYVTWDINQHENLYKTKPYETFTILELTGNLLM